MRDLLPVYRDSTREFYADTARYYVLPHFQTLMLSDITPRFVQAYMNQYARTYSRSLQKHVRATLNSLFNTAVSWRYLKENPCKGLRLPHGKPVQRAQVLSPAQISLLVNHLLTPFREMVLVAATTSLRPSELWGLGWCDIDESGIHVRQRLYRRHVGPTKTLQSVRDIPLASEVLNQLNPLRGQPDSLVFHAAKGGPVRSDEVIQSIRPIAEKLGLPAFTRRSFRRSAETLMHNNGISLKTQSAVLGHSNVNTTVLYAEPTEEGKQAAAKLLGELTCASFAQIESKPVGGLAKCWCERGDSNPHPLRDQILSLARLPIPPLSHNV